MCLARYMLSPVRPSVCQMPSSVHTVIRWLVVSVVEFHAHVTVQRVVRGTKGMKTPRMVRKVRGTKRPRYEKSTYGTKRLWYE